MPQQFRAASPRTAAKKAFHWCFFPSCQRVLSDTLPRQQKSQIRTSHSALDTSSYKQTGFYRRHCLKTILIWMGQYLGVWKTILARSMSSISSSTLQVAEPAVPQELLSVPCYLWSPAASLPPCPPPLSIPVFISTQCSPPKCFNISGQILLGQSTGQPWSTSPFQECTVSYDPEEMVFQKERKIFSNSRKRWTVSRNSAPCMKTV